SRYVAERESLRMVVVPNARDPKIFYDDGREKIYDLIYVGGINRIKGADLLFEAVERMVASGIRINRVTYVGEGELVDDLKNRLTDGRIGSCEIVFTGNLESRGVAEMLRYHRCMVAPTNEELIAEAFPCVCLEGAACGCTIVSSNSGGMSESMGPAGITFDSRSIQSLCNAIEKVIVDRWTPPKDKVAAHLSKYTPEGLVEAYFKLMGK
ncbi:MAG: glycosyltransferase family 4 protein, partial [Kiritimatiellae bacterium]|nr:glycosyltransferase family 4 protein [Kiritimatiellia bacterium]